LAKYQEKHAELPGRWVSKDNLHITLEFLGGLTDVEIADVCRVVGEVVKKYSPFSLNLSKVCYSGEGKKVPKMIWAKGEKSKELSDLKNGLQNALLEVIRFSADNRAFSPHITLVRLKEWELRRIEPEELPEVNEDVDLTFTVESIEVMESELKRKGPQYTTLESFNLK